MKPLPNYRRALGYIWPQKRLLALMVLAVLGVSLFYTLSISSVLPVLQVMFNRNQTLPDWIYQVNTEHRLEVGVQNDTDQGVRLSQVRHGPLAEAGLKPQDTIVALDGRTAIPSDLMRSIVALPTGRPVRLTVERIQADSQNARQRHIDQFDVTVVPVGAKWYTPVLLRMAERLPQGHDPESKFLTLELVIGGLFLAVLLGGICDFCHTYLVAMLNERAMVKMRSEVFGHVIDMPMSWFAKLQAGDTLSRFARDTSIIETGFKITFEKVLSEPLKAAGVFGFSLWLNPRLMLLILIVVPGAGWIIYTLGNRIKRAQRRASAAWGQVLDLLDEKILGIKILKTSCAQHRERLQFFRLARKIFVHQLKISRSDAAAGPVLEVLGAAAVSSFILWGGWQVFRGDISASAFFAAAACLGAMLAPIQRVASVNNRLQQAESAAARIFEVIDSPCEQEVSDPVELSTLKKAIEFRDVRFTYPGADRPALCDVNLAIKAGETVAVVGPNGSGKTTLSSLLLRFFAPQAGQVLVDGVDIQTVSLRSVRRQIGLVTQDTVIFTDTIRNNIAYANPKASEEQVHAAARAAHADDFILNVHTEHEGRERVGYDAIVSSRTLSGGQKQRIAIARAVLNNPAILIFDEATSQVDADSEKKIQEALAELTRGRTTIIIAHRLSTVISADRIAVMDKGRIVAVGTHQHLLESNEQYRTFCNAQLQPA